MWCPGEPPGRVCAATVALTVAHLAELTQRVPWSGVHARAAFVKSSPEKFSLSLFSKPVTAARWLDRCVQVHESGKAMVDTPALLQALSPEEKAALQVVGASGELSAELIASIDSAAGGPGEGRGYYVYAEGAGPDRPFKLRDDVAAAIAETRT